MLHYSISPTDYAVNQTRTYIEQADQWFGYRFYAPSGGLPKASRYAGGRLLIALSINISLVEY